MQRNPVEMDNTAYSIEYGGKGGNIWEITLPADPKADKKKRK